MKLRINTVDLVGKDIVRHLTTASMTAHCFEDAILIN